MSQFFTKLFVIVSFLTFASECLAQLSPPGLDDTHVVLWGAVGTSQSINEKWSIQSYIGASRFSNPNNSTVLKKQAIYVIDEQVYRSLNKHWQLGACVSFRGQNMYSDEAPYDNAIPALRREMRYYLRLFYRHHTGRFSFAYSLRPEWRNFYSPDWSRFYTSPQMMRYRIKAQASFAFGHSRNSSFVLANELLFIEAQQRQPSGDLKWNSVAWSEDRISTYYRYAFKKKKIMVDLGMMQQLNFNNNKFVNDFVHFAIDAIFIDPFGTRKKEKS